MVDRTDVGVARTVAEARGHEVPAGGDRGGEGSAELAPLDPVVADRSAVGREAGHRGEVRPTARVFVLPVAPEDRNGRRCAVHANADRLGIHVEQGGGGDHGSGYVVVNHDRNGVLPHADLIAIGAVIDPALEGDPIGGGVRVGDGPEGALGDQGVALGGADGGRGGVGVIHRRVRGAADSTTAEVEAAVAKARGAAECCRPRH